MGGERGFLSRDKQKTKRGLVHEKKRRSHKKIWGEKRGTPREKTIAGKKPIPFYHKEGCPGRGGSVGEPRIGGTKKKREKSETPPEETIRFPKNGENKSPYGLPSRLLKKKQEAEFS